MQQGWLCHASEGRYMELVSVQSMPLQISVKRQHFSLLRLMLVAFRSCEYGLFTKARAVQADEAIMFIWLNLKIFNIQMSDIDIVAGDSLSLCGTQKSNSDNQQYPRPFEARPADTASRSERAFRKLHSHFFKWYLNWQLHLCFLRGTMTESDLVSVVLQPNTWSWKFINQVTTQAYIGSIKLLYQDWSCSTGSL